jgi:hypothetical protein
MRKRTLFVGIVIAFGAGLGSLEGGCSSALVADGGIGIGFDSGGGGSKGDGSGSSVACLTPASSFGTAGASTQMLNACSQTEIATLDSMINSATGTTYVALYGMVGASCQKCLFSSSTDANWQYFVWVPDMQTVINDLDGGTGMSTVFDNSVGACIAHVSSGGAACSLATTHNDECYQSSCETCVSQSDFDSCVNASQTATQCSATDTRATDCMTKDQYDQALVQCGFDLNAKTLDFKALLNVTCGTGAAAGDGGMTPTEGGTTSEGGTDAGPG